MGGNEGGRDSHGSQADAAEGLRAATSSPMWQRTDPPPQLRERTDAVRPPHNGADAVTRSLPHSPAFDASNARRRCSVSVGVATSSTWQRARTCCHLCRCPRLALRAPRQHPEPVNAATSSLDVAACTGSALPPPHPRTCTIGPEPTSSRRVASTKPRSPVAVQCHPHPHVADTAPAAQTPSTHVANPKRSGSLVLVSSPPIHATSSR
ncbi:hypothetical protein BDN70DRAFT_939950 [Pholiota conissans]|uniref:Uncharacterized protein n=1 Tax=Pholiota conissans TaxID=109636 RepID=A0A9P5YJQ5_9AGAR|nr:hypothetical protein BDN70DRAFT_939950 [Pholiota conissans]